MTALLTKLERRWMSFTLRQSWITAAAKQPVVCEGTKNDAIYCKAHASTLPPEPVIPAKKPFKVELLGGKRYSWCTCGHSKKQPFCDGAHKTRAPGLSPLRFVPETDSTAWLCGCKHTKRPPYCDGTHKQDFVVSAPLHQHSDP